MAIELDRTDQRILSEIQADATLTTQAIADRVGLSQSPCWRRIRRLEDAGLIDRRVSLLNRKALGFEILIFAEVKLVANESHTLADFEHAVSQYPEVLECHTLLGETDYLLKIVTRSIADYEALYRERLSRIPGVQETHSKFVMSEIKNTTALPL